MQKRVVYDFNAQTATESAAENSTDKAVKTSNAIGKIKRAFSGKSFKFVVLIVLLFASLFCAIGSADWIISQQKVVPNVAGNSIFKFDDLGFGAHVNNGKPTGNYTFNGSSISISMSVAAVGGAQNLPASAIEAQNIRYRVKKCAPDTKPENLNEELFNSDYATVLPKDAGTYAVLITSEADGVSYGKTIKVFTIAPCPVKIEWSGAVGFTYDGTDHSSNITATARTENGVAVNENIFEISFSYKAHGATTFTPVTEVKNAGTYTATAEISDNNYTISSNEAATFTIEQKALTVTAEDKTVTYGDSAHYTATYKGLLDCDKGKLGTPNFTCEFNKVGNHSITVDGLKNSNYAITYVNGTLTVNARTVTLDWGTDNSFIYDGTAHTLNPDAKNVVNNDNLGLTVTITGENISGFLAINVGTYTATASITNKNYVIDENNKSATFTITARALTIIANNHEIIYGSAPATNGYTISGIIEGETPETANIGGTVKLTTTYTQYGKVGEYDIIVDISGLSSSNYSFTAVNGKLTVNKKELTVTAKNHEITYGEEPSANGYTINGFVNNENESVIKGLENITYIIDYAQWQDIGWFSITPKVDGLSAVNYSFKANSDGILNVKQLNIQLSGIIERDYDGSEFLFDKNLFTTATATFTAPQNPGIDLKKLPNDIDIYQCISNAGNAQNFDSDNGIAVTPENGLFSYAFGKPIEAGSTYKIDKVTLNNKNFNLTKTEVYLKYKTAKVGDKFYTIEDAINSNVTGDIILASNSTDTDTHVVSAFTSLNYYNGKSFTCSKNIIVPHADGATTFEHQQTQQTGNVGSVLIIPNGVSLTMSSSSLNILAVISQNNTVNTCTTAKRGVVMNQGTLTVKNQIKSGKNIVPNILAYGYLKGNGNVHVENGATVTDLFHLYDFKGGVITYGIHKNTKEYLPINSYSIHNISCNVRVSTGCVYNTYYEITMGGEWFSGIIPVVSTADSAALFKLSSGYIEKRAIPAESATWKNKKDSTGITYGESLDKITGSNQLAGQKEDIRICGTAVDGSIKITVTLKKILSVDMETGTNNPLPVPYMDIRVCNGGDLSLVNSSYKFMPGSSLTVDDGGKLTLSANAKLVLYSVEDCSVLEAPVTYKKSDGTITSYPYSFITRYCIDKVDAYLLINSNNVTLNGGISGKIISEKSGIKLEIKKDSADITVLNVVHDGATQLWPTNFYYADVTTRKASSARPMKPCGNIIQSYSTAEESFFSAGTYYSTKIDSDYVWYKNSATITYHTNGGTLNGTSGITTQNITLPSGGYISSNLPKPTRPYYEFNGWYYDSALTQKATAIFASCDLYAKWTPIQYTIVYNFPYDECGTLVNGSLSGTEVKTLATPRQQTITVDGTEYTFSGWYLNSDRTGKPITEVSAVNANKQNIINVYAFYRGGTYTVNYEEDPENLLHNNNLTAKKPESQTFDKGMAVPELKLNSLNSYNDDTSFMFYFAGWYLSTDSSGTTINSLPSTINGDITLCAKWIKKAQLKIELPVFENGNRTGNTTIYDTHKYFYKQKTDPIGIKNLLTYIGAGYTVPENYKFIGFNASSGFTATQDYSDMNNITTRIEVGATSDVLTITADIRKILRVDITMTASAIHKYGIDYTGTFNIDKVTLTNGSYYSTDKLNWKQSDNSSIYSGKNFTLYILSGENKTQSDTQVTVSINDIKDLGVWPNTADFYATESELTVTNCKKSNQVHSGKVSTFTFTITDDSAQISWYGKQKK